MSKPEYERIKYYAQQLHLPSFVRYGDVIRKMTPEDGYEQFLEQMLRAETEERLARAQARRLKSAGFPLTKTLDEFDRSQLQHVSEAEIAELATCEFVRSKQNVVMIGNPGTGKTHLAIALGVKAVYAGYRVRFFTAASLATSLTEALSEKELGTFKKNLAKTDLLIIDELSYLTFNRPQSELMFQVISDRSERASVIITTNLDFSDWIQMFENQMMLSAMVDRVTFHSHILNMNSAEGGISYRLASTKKHMI